MRIPHSNYLVFFILILNSPTIFCQCINGDCINGFGEKKYPDSSRFVGNFEKGTKKSGTYFYPNGDVYKGSFEKNQRSGIAVYTHQNGEVFTGSFANDKKAYGKYVFLNGDVYTGTFENSLPDGYGTIVTANGKKWEGNWDKGKRIWGGNVSANTDSVVVDSIINDTQSSKSIQNEKSITPRIFAVVVGISDYDGSDHDLKYSDNDARLFYNHLLSALPREMSRGKSILLLNSNATRANIINAMNQIFSQSTENDFIIFYFSGHGTQGNFCPTDLSYQQLLSHDIVKAQFKNAKARFRLCVADACFSGSIGAQSQNSSISSSTQQLRDARIAVIMSSKPNQTSIERGSLNQGIFSYYFINGLKGAADLNHDSYVTMGELFLYTKTATTQKSNGQQIPVVYGKNLDRIPLTRIKK
jgi:hypothetical protein